MSGAYASPPRPLGVRHRNGLGPGRVVRGPYPYAIGDRIAGDLTITGHLAAGRLGHLYQVWSAREWCAFTCKIVAPEHRRQRRFLAAMRRETRILRSVRHPNLIHCYGWGEHDGLPFILLEYLDGPSLFDFLEKQPRRRLDVADAIRVAIHLGSALYHLHRKGYLHLDLKPANLILRDSMPVLIDLDAARRIESGRPVNRLGTAPYMAPEQVTCAKLSPAADVYGIGALLYELLTGRWPFEDVYMEEEPRVGLERQYPQLAGRPPQPPRQFEPVISQTLENTVMRCLAPIPEDRFQSVHPLLLALSRELDESNSLWPRGVFAERRRAPRE